MFTLIHLNSRFNKPSTLQPFLQNNAGTPIPRVDFVSPYMRTEDGTIVKYLDLQVQIHNNK